MMRKLCKMDSTTDYEALYLAASTHAWAEYRIRTLPSSLHAHMHVYPSLHVDHTLP